MTPDIVVGCPVSHRSWIIEEWFARVDEALRMVSIRSPFFVFVADPTKDPDSCSLLARHAKGRGLLVATNEPERTDDSRGWDNRERIEKMVGLRNTLLQAVREVAPPVFLSLDSDILIHPEALGAMLDSLNNGRGWSAVGTRCYMSPPPSKQYPSYMTLSRSQGYPQRKDPEFRGAFEVDVIMAAKLMLPKAYGVDYVAHMYGEDVGWSIHVRDRGMRIGWDCRTTSKHVMEPGDLGEVDPRCGW